MANNFYLIGMAILILLITSAMVITKVISSDNDSKHKIVWIVAIIFFPLPALIGWLVGDHK